MNMLKFMQNELLTCKRLYKFILLYTLKKWCKQICFFFPLNWIIMKNYTSEHELWKIYNKKNNWKQKII